MSHLTLGAPDRAGTDGRPTWPPPPWLAALAGAALVAAAGCAEGEPAPPKEPLVVDTLEDAEPPPAGLTTLRQAIAAAAPGQPIRFDPGLDGGVIELAVVGEPHSILPGEVYAGGPPTFQGYHDRDYGPSALHASKDLVIDASALPHGITLRWAGGDARRARVLAVRGNLTLRNVTVTGGYSAAEPRDDTAQPFTLARGGGLAVWGTARLEGCTVSGNRVLGDDAASRDRGAYGGGIYADGLQLEDAVVAGNWAMGYGAAGGGIYSVGGAANEGGAGNPTSLSRCSISGNRVTAQHAYGGGVFTLSGGPENVATMTLTSCTVARNLVEDHPDLPQAGQWYHRGGGIYMGGGSLSLVSTTIAGNAVTGTPAVFGGKPNLGGGGVAATIGDAHVVEDVRLRQSILVGNTVNGEPGDWFVGSLLFLDSGGYNLVGVLDVSQILVPVPAWSMLSRKHYPKTGDCDGVAAAQALDLDHPRRHPSALSVGTDAGQLAVLSFPPAALAIDRVPAAYTLSYTMAGYNGFGGPDDDFLEHVLTRLRADPRLGQDFGAGLGDLSGVSWYGPSRSWPSNPENQPWIAAWRSIDALAAGRLGQVILGDEFWDGFSSGPLDGHLWLTVQHEFHAYHRTSTDQLGSTRPQGAAGDIGAIEQMGEREAAAGARGRSF